MNSQGTYFYESKPGNPINYNWRYGGVTYPDSEMSQMSYPSDRNRGPLGDLYTSVDRTRDARTGPVVIDRGSGIVRSRSPMSLTAPNVYELDHLASFTATGSVPGRLMTPPEGVRRVREMARSGLIWPLRVQLVIGDRELLVLDVQTGEDMEYFPLSLVSEPTCATAVDRRVNGCDVLDNLVLFTVLEDPVKQTSPPEMHVFQCINCIGQHFVDDVLSTKNSKMAAKTASSVISDAASVYSQQRSTHNTSFDSFRAAEQTAKAASRYQAGPPARQMFHKAMSHEGLQPVGPDFDPEEMTHRSVTLLDRCFTDIEQFVVRIQQAADAYKELDNRRSVRVNKHSKHSGDGLLHMRAKPPPPADFADILQKFKLSFILLARLKGSIRDPNAPELVHFLFAPLSLVVESSRSDIEPAGSSGGLASRVIAPLPTPEAHDLLDNCLTSKESELLRSLGPAWTTSIDRWQGEIPTYLPRFCDGWQPPAFWLEEIGVPAAGPAPHQPPARCWINGTDDMASDSRAGYARSQVSSDLSSNADREMRLMIELQRRLAHGYHRQREMELNRQMAQTVIRDSSPNELTMPVRRAEMDRFSNGLPQLHQTSGPASADRVHVTDYRDQMHPRSVMTGHQVAASWPQSDGHGTGQYGDHHDRRPAVMPVSHGYTTVDDFVQQLKSRNAKIFRVVHGRESKNSKELTVRTGEILEVLDDQKNWWKVRNASGDVGYVPKTIIEPYSG